MEIGELRNLTALRGWKQIVVFIFAVAVSAALLFVVLSGEADSSLYFRCRGVGSVIICSAFGH